MHSLEIQFRNLSAKDARHAPLWMLPEAFGRRLRLEKKKRKQLQKDF